MKSFFYDWFMFIMPLAIWLAASFGFEFGDLITAFYAAVGIVLVVYFVIFFRGTKRKGMMGLIASTLLSLAAGIAKLLDFSVFSVLLFSFCCALAWAASFEALRLRDRQLTGIKRTIMEIWDAGGESRVAAHVAYCVTVIMSVYFFVQHLPYVWALMQVLLLAINALSIVEERRLKKTYNIA